MRFIILIFTLFCVCCAPPAPPKPIPHFSLELHGDVDFTLYERHLIRRACDSLHAQIGMDISVQYDLNFADQSSLAQHQAEPVLVRLDENVPLVQMYDISHGGKIYAFTDNTHVFVVWERMDTADLYVSVLMHEFLHTQGVRHVKVREALMYGSSENGTLVPLTVTEADREAMRQAVGK